MNIFEDRYLMKLVSFLVFFFWFDFGVVVVVIVIFGLRVDVDIDVVFLVEDLV